MRSYYFIVNTYMFIAKPTPYFYTTNLEYQKILFYINIFMACIETAEYI